MLYEKGRELIDLSTQHWLHEEVFSDGWYMILGVLILAYSFWFILLDKSRALQIMFLGALSAVAYTLNSLLLGNYLGLVDYNIRIFPISTALFLSSITLSPIIIMFAYQIKQTWSGYLVLSGVGFAFLNFAVFTLYTALGIITFYRGWNVIYHFLVLYAISLGVRLAYGLICRLTNSAQEKKTQRNGMKKVFRDGYKKCSE